jgi:catechol 2,3-dioxygenase-like lactoylglutathione lyase family enzyme
MPNYSYHHIHLASPDPAKTAKFYQDMFDAEEVRRTERPDGSVTDIHLNLGGVMLVVMPQGADAKTAPTERGAISGLDHIGIRTDDINATVANLKANGVNFRDDITDFRPGVRIACFWAPEDVLVELVEIKR